MDSELDSVLPVGLEGEGGELMDDENPPKIKRDHPKPEPTNLKHLKREKAWALRSVLKGNDYSHLVLCCVRILPDFTVDSSR